MQRNRLKDILTTADYPELFGIQKGGGVPDRISSFWVGQQAEFSVVKSTGKPEMEIREAVKTAVEQFLKYLSRQVTEGRIVELQSKIADLEKRNKELDDKLNKFNRLLLPFLEILEEERQIEEKLQKEMPELKFEKQDPFALAKGGWTVPYERLKELLEEE